MKTQSYTTETDLGVCFILPLYLVDDLWSVSFPLALLMPILVNVPLKDA